MLNCIVSELKRWSTCSVSCGPGGTAFAKRLLVQKPAFGGLPCPPLLSQRDCNDNVACPPPPTPAPVPPTPVPTVPCKLGNWTAWSPCAVHDCETYVMCGLTNKKDVSCNHGHTSRDRLLIDKGSQATCPAIHQTRACKPGPSTCGRMSLYPPFGIA